MFLVYPTEYWSLEKHAIRIVDERDDLQYAARDIYDCIGWLKAHGQTEFLAPRAGALHVLSFDDAEVDRQAKGVDQGWELPDSDDVAEAFLQRFGPDRLHKIIRWWNPLHSFVSFDTAPGAAPEPGGGDPVEVAETLARLGRTKPEAIH